MHLIFNAALASRLLIAPLLYLVLLTPTANAFCLAPQTEISGYKIPLDDEIKTAQSIIVGRVIQKNELKEDATDPVGITAYTIKIKVKTRLKGKLPDTISVRDENTSARYGMLLGEEHVLFISEDRDGTLWVDSCGNSAPAFRSQDLIKKIEAELRKR
ncbi:hypothetical protein GTP45_15235 [Pseudoduganella sp. FT55W]|uniref:Uncharacterized protein n=1 Tax=Duganella rivi TaxID=2666083 RepID=A0A7X4GR75_9BURK|nr:hypothetical protein [Duganella rivi]MYM68173.1 hypothetical protein [Duganella rivi]